MVLTTLKSAEYSAFMGRLNAGGKPDFDSTFDMCHSGPVANRSPVISDNAAAESNAARYRICLECSLPLRSSESMQALACHCVQYEEAKDDWLEINGWEIVFIFGLTVAFVAVSYWLCL
jgi:hypothetical protein